MLKTLVKITGIIAGLVLSGAVYAMGMGGINVKSALGQPLNAQIDLLSVNKSDMSGLSARLASPDAFKGAGIDYPYSLPKIKFKVKTHSDGSAYLSMTTQDAVNAPFVSLLVELDWASGKLLREYTFLLDPPGYKAAQPKPEVVQPVAPTAAPAPQAPPQVKVAPKVKALPKSEAMPMRSSAPMDRKALAAKPAPANVASGPIRVKRGDTLTKIAKQIKQPDVTLEQMLVALYRANAGQFDGHNMNRIRAGKILRRPTDADLAHLSNSEAVKVIHAQAADWHAYRQKLAAASSVSSGQAAKQEVSGKISTSVADQTPAAKQSAKEVLRLSKGEAPGDKIAAGKSAQAMQDRIHSLEEEAVARQKELKDSKTRIALLEKNIKEMQHLLKLKGLPVPPAKSEAASKVAAPAAPAAKQPAKPAPKPATKPAPKPKPRHKVVHAAPPPPAPSLMSEIIGNPLYLGGIAAVVLALGGLGFFAARRRGKGNGKKIDIRSAMAEKAGETTASHIAEPVAPSPDTGDFTGLAEEEAGPAATESEQTDEEVDPIGEAELFMNFGRYAQAEEVLKEALNKDPNNLKYLLKLLSVYASQKDVNAFSSFARRVQDSGDAEAWEQAAAMGRKIDPSNPMYGGASAEEDVAAGAETNQETGEAATTDFDLDEGKSETPAALDFDLGFGASETEEAAPETAAATEEIAEPETETTEAMPEPAPEETMEFQQTTKIEPEQTLGSEEPSQLEKTTILSSEEMRAGQEAPLDFDITTGGEEVSEPAAEQPQAEEAAQSEAEPEKAEDLGLDFDISSANPDASAPSESETVDVTAAEEKENEPSLDDLIFDVTATNPGMPAAGSKAEGEAETAEEGKLAEIDLGDINLNLDVGEEKAPEEAEGKPEAENKDEHWHEVATKLDLAKAYQEMGDAEGAREILDEVVRDGDDQQRETAQALLDQLSA